jgi:hypothetical protein
MRRCWRWCCRENVSLNILHNEQISVGICAYSVRQLCCDGNVSAEQFLDLSILAAHTSPVRDTRGFEDSAFWEELILQ